MSRESYRFFPLLLPMTFKKLKKALTNCVDTHKMEVIILRPIITVALNTGMRKSELLNLKWEDINFHNKTILVRNSKNNEARVIPMNEPVYLALKISYTPGKEYVFNTKDGTPHRELKTGFNASLIRAGIKDFRFHDLRHTFASHLAMKGCNLQTIQKLMGHKDFKMTLRYSHLSKSFLQEAVNSLNKSFENGTNMAQEVSTEKIQVPKSLINFNAPLAQLGRASDS